MSQWNIAAKSQEERDKVNVDLAASGVAYKERRFIPAGAGNTREPLARGAPPAVYPRWRGEHAVPVYALRF